MSVGYLLGAIGVMAAVMFLLRATPFVLFGLGRRPPRAVLYLGRVMSPAAVAMLIIYCMGGVDFGVWPSILPEAIAVGAIVLVHLKWRNMALSVFGGTLLYMLLVQFLFRG
ncbi:MAG: AzlD domain-containing protein [Victivallaceae bacterium]|nr:AzlD domain-containing protein [Victivallaceae bacterium]